MDFDLRQLETFCHLIEQRSFTRAASALRLSQATISERIAGLEREVGARLVDRLGRTVMPTPLGKQLHERAMRLLGERDQLRAHLATCLGVGGGQARIGASTIPGEYVLPGCLADFRRLHAGARVSVHIADSEAIRARVVAGDLELGVVGSHGTEPHLQHEALWRDELVIAVPAGHRWQRHRAIRVAELVDEPFVLREQGSGTRAAIERALASALEASDASLDVVAELGSTAACKEGVRCGLGVSIVSSRAVAAEVRTGVLHTLRLSDVELSRDFYLVSDSRRTRSPLCEALARYFRGDAGR
ncbi:MAG: LysR family transcriptional regulator [Planctomycetes bacterium]|nr:LysR family transcriptional regulator [Planctomycetota bacterium]